jgi:hypothetical protein
VLLGRSLGARVRLKASGVVIQLECSLLPAVVLLGRSLEARARLNAWDAH